MSNRDPDVAYNQLKQVLPFCFSQELKNVHTIAPGIVRGYHARTKRASVQIALNMIVSIDGTLDNLKSMARPVILDVPVCHPSGGGYVVHLPLREPDPVILFFSERGIETFKETFDVSDPPIDAIFAERDAIAYPGFGALEISPATDGLTVQTEDGGTYISVKPGDIVIRASRITLQGDTDTWVIP